LPVAPKPPRLVPCATAAPQVSVNGVPAACAVFRRCSHGCEVGCEVGREVAGGTGAVGCCARAAIPIAATTVNVMLCDFFMWTSHALRKKYASFSAGMRKNLTSGCNSAATGQAGGLGRNATYSAIRGISAFVVGQAILPNATYFLQRK
jgi:hypothetical protein